MIDLILKALDDMKAFDIEIIDVRQQTSITDYMIIASARSSRQVKAVAEQVALQMKQAGVPLQNPQTAESSDWSLLDFGDCIVHIMQPATRAYYGLEELWGNKAQHNGNSHTH